MNVIETGLSGLLIVEPLVHGDERGFFFESWNEAAFQNAGINARFAQDNHSRSSRGVLRGVHFQNPNPQGKLVRVASGAAFDVAVDLRRSSPTFGKWAGVELSAKNRRMLWVPEGFGHGFLALEDDTDLLYKCTALYSQADEGILAWNDPAVGIEWPLNGMAPVLSSKDARGLTLSEIECFA